MMREILFRGKSLDNGEWEYGNLIISPFHENCVMIERQREFMKKSGWYRTSLVNPETVGQFTGITDKNGTKIFEWDICRVSRVGTVAYGKITFKNGCYWFVDDGFGGLLRLCDCKTNGFNIEIIGNLFDNPELLKGGADNG